MSIEEIQNEIIDEFAMFEDWEERYQYMIDLGKDLPAMDESLRTSERLVKGCQSNVWMDVSRNEGLLYFTVDSAALIVRGVLSLVMAAFDGKSAADITAFDIDGYFQALDLERHLSPTRGNGLRAIVAKIRTIAGAVSHS